ncbi:MAG: STAS domain-containing protein [Oricola sp.]
MNITEENLGDGAVKLSLQGLLDRDGSAAAGPRLTRAVADFDTTLVDLKGVPAIGAAGLRVLVGAAMSVDRSRARLVAVNAPEAARRVMYTTGLDGIVNIADDDATGYPDAA